MRRKREQKSPRRKKSLEQTGRERKSRVLPLIILCFLNPPFVLRKKRQKDCGGSENTSMEKITEDLCKTKVRGGRELERKSKARAQRPLNERGRGRLGVPALGKRNYRLEYREGHGALTVIEEKEKETQLKRLVLKRTAGLCVG